jgi:uncharacterized protein
MKTKSQPKPSPVKNRIAYLDILRGMAILFIFSANIVFLSGYYFLSDQTLATFPLTHFDEIFDFIMYTLVDGKFYSIFSLLFGIGFVVQYNNLKKYNKPFVQFFRRRMFWLLIIGFLHLHIWVGDILTLYAILGFVLIMFRNKTNKQLLKWSIVLILLPIVNWIFINATGWNYPSYFFKIYGDYWQNIGLPMLDVGTGQLRPDNLQYYTIDSLSGFFQANYKRPFLRLGMILSEGRAFKVLGIFLIGVWAGRKILNENILTNTKLLKRIAIYGFLIGLPFSIFRSIIEFYLGDSSFWSFMHTLTYAFGTVPLAMAYAAGIALICHNKSTWLRWFAPVGQMALSNYLFQTLIAISVFYSIGFGFAGKLGFTTLMSFVVSVFTIQNFFSKWWLSHFKYGPMEWIWRQLTYGKRISIRK